MGFLEWLYNEILNKVGGDAQRATAEFNKARGTPFALEGAYKQYQAWLKSIGKPSPQDPGWEWDDKSGRPYDLSKQYPSWLTPELVSLYPQIQREFPQFLKYLQKYSSGETGGVPGGPRGAFDPEDVRRLFQDKESFKRLWAQAGLTPLTRTLDDQPGPKDPFWSESDWWKQWGGKGDEWIRTLLSNLFKSFGPGGDAGQGYEGMGRALLMKELQRMFGGKGPAQSTSPFGENYLPAFADPTQYFQPGLINQAYNTAAGNLGSQMQQAGGQAGNQAAAMAASRGLVNPSGFTMRARSQAQAPFAQQFGGLEAARGKELAGQQPALFNALMQQQGLREGARQFQIGSQFQQGQDTWNRAMQGLGLGQFFSTTNKPDKAWDIFGMLTKAGLAWLLGGK